MDDLVLSLNSLEDEIRNGKNLILYEPIYDTKFNVLIGTEKILTEKDVNRIKERCPESVYKPIRVRQTIPHFIEEEKREKWVGFIIACFEANKTFKGLSRDKKDFVIKYLRNTLTESDYVIWKLSQLKSFSKKYFDHSINTCFISLIVYQAYSCKYLSGMIDGNMMEKIINSALLHDIGITKFESDRVEKKRIEIVEKKDAFFQHPIESYKIIQSEIEKHEIDNEIKDAILNHEEFIDGSGSPRGISGEDLGFLIRLLSISDYFELLQSGEWSLKIRHYRDTVAKMRLEKNKFDPGLLESLELSFKYLFQS